MQDKETNNKEDYEVYVFCKSCLLQKKISITKGRQVTDVNCPQCGNATLKIDHNGELFDKPKSRNNFI